MSPGDLSDRNLPLSVCREIDAACDRFESAWLSGQRPRIEDHLAGFPPAAQRALLEELLRIDLEHRQRLEEQPTEEDYAVRFPGDIDLVRELLAEANSPVRLGDPPAPSTNGALEQPAATDHLAVPVLTDFQFIRRLGRGRHGEAWLATDTRVGEQRAVKVFHRDIEGSLAGDLLSEQQALMTLPPHRNRVRVYEFISGEKTCFQIMEYVAGEPLIRHCTPEGPLSWERAARYVADIGDALGELHAAGILHRDIKPQNILWDPERAEALLSDVGMAACAAAAHQPAGTPGYLAPELNRLATAKSDVFALAATLFTLIAGRAPFAEDSAFVSMTQARLGLERSLPELAGMPPAIEDLIIAGLEPAPEQRVELSEFIGRLRGAHLQALADMLLRLGADQANEIGLRVRARASRTTAPVGGFFRRLTQRGRAAVVSPPDEDVEIEVIAEVGGYLTALSLDGGGPLGLVFPKHREAQPDRASQPQKFHFTVVPPPKGGRLLALWTRQADALLPKEWAVSRLQGRALAIPPENSTRGMDAVLHQAIRQPRGSWAAASADFFGIEP